MDNDDPYFPAITSNLSWLNRIAWMLFSCAFAVTTAKLLSSDSFGIGGVSISVNNSVFVLLILTVCHAYIATNLVHSLGVARSRVSAETREAFYLKCLLQGGILVRGTTDLRDHFVEPKERHTVQIKQEARDPSVWVHSALAISALVMCVPFEIRWTTPVIIGFSISLIIENFNIGSSWVVALADFGRKDRYSRYFTEGPTEIRTRAIPISGPLPFYLGRQIDSKHFIVTAVLEIVMFGLFFSVLLFPLWIVAEVVQVAKSIGLSTMTRP